MNTRALGCFVALGVALAAVSACGPSASAPPALPAPAPPPAKESAASARYLLLRSSFIERREDGLDLVIAGGRRLLAKGPRVVGKASDETEVNDGFVLPSWVKAEARRYLFWMNNELYATPRWDGELERIATLRVPPARAFDWLDGAGLVVAGGAYVVKASGAIEPFPMAAATLAVAASERRALRVNLFGRAELSLDGGASYRDLRNELGRVRGLDMRGDAIALRLEAGGERFIDAAGRVSSSPPVEIEIEGSARHRRPPDDEPDMWPDGKSEALRRAVTAGIPLADGGAVIAGSGFVGRFDLETLRTTSAVPMPGVSEDADCAPIRVRDATLVVCSSELQAAVINLAGAPRMERSFDRAGAPDLDRFVGDMESGLGYLGPCEGVASSLPISDMNASDEVGNGWSSRSPVFCVRKSADEWVEHKLDPADSSDVLGWIPRPDGGAVAIIARPGNLLEESERLSVRGGLRVVRVARNEPPLSLPSYNYEGSELLKLSMWIDAQGDIRAWLPSNNGGSNLVPVRIDRNGHASVLPVPLGADSIAAAGRFALLRARDADVGGMFETTDGGESFRAVEPPPDARARSNMPSSCSALGCILGAFARVGWQPDAPSTSSTAFASRRSSDAKLSRGRPSTPLVRLRCGFDGPPQSRAQTESFGFGVTASPVPRGTMPVGVGHAGVLLAPWGGQQLSMQGNVELGWLTPFDPAASIKRVTIPGDKISPDTLARRVYQVELGYVLEPKAEIGLLPVGPSYRCISELLEKAGMARSIGACAEAPTVAVDLGGRLLSIHPSGSSLVISRGRGLSASATRTSRADKALPGVLRELFRSPLSVGAYGYSFGAGEREGTPVAVVMDVAGRALLAPIDVERSELGPEEPLAPLTEAKLGDHPSCADRASGGAEATVLLPLDSELGLVTDELAGVLPSGTFALGLFRWSRARACLDAVEIRVRDERFDPNVSNHYDPPGTLRKLIARFRGPSRGASLALIMQGAEVRQRLSCSGLVAGEGP